MAETKTVRVARPPALSGTARGGLVMLAELPLVGAAVAAEAADYAVAGALAALCAIVVLAGSVRIEGVPPVEALRLRSRLRRAAQGTAAPAPGPGSDRRLLTLRQMTPSFRVRDTIQRGRTLGVASDAEGWFAVLEVAPWTGLNGGREGRIPLESLLPMVSSASLPVTAIQAVTTTTAGRLLDAAAPCRASYANLDGAVAATENTLHLVARLDTADALAAAETRGGGADGVDRALATTIGRLGAAVTRAGFRYRVLGGEEIVRTLAEVLLPFGVPKRLEPTADRLESWHCEGLAHRVWLLERWPHQTVADLHRQLAAVGLPVTSTSVTVSAPDGGRRPQVTGLVRIAAHEDLLILADARLAETLASGGGAARLLHGRQRAAGYAAAPTGARPW